MGGNNSGMAGLSTGEDIGALLTVSVEGDVREMVDLDKLVFSIKMYYNQTRASLYHNIFMEKFHKF